MDALSVICSHEHFVGLNLPAVVGAAGTKLLADAKVLATVWKLLTMLEPCWNFVGTCGTVLEPLPPVVGAVGAKLSANAKVLATVCNRVGSELESCWNHVGTVLELCWALCKLIERNLPLRLNLIFSST